MKRVLIIAYFFPPVSNMGSHRILRFVRHLRDFGWEPIVLTGQFTGWRETDDRLLKQLPANLEVHRVGSLDLTVLWQKLRRRGNSPAKGGNSSQSQGQTTALNRWVMVPDKYFPWIGPAARAGRDLLRQNRFDAIYSTSDPVSDHLVAKRIATATGVPWLAEFRDLWLGSPYFARAHPTPIHRAVHAHLERSVARKATAAVALSRGIQQYFIKTYPAVPAHILYNCFDASEYEPAPAAEGFSIVYAGALYSSRSPEPFFAGFAQFLRQYQVSDARFDVVGGSPDLDLPALANKYGVAEQVKLVGRVSHAEALRRMQAATALLAVQSPDDNVHVPGKLFEYIGARRPIFLMSRPCEVAEMVTEHQLGWVAEPTAASVAAKLGELYTAWQTRGHAGLTVAAANRFDIQEGTRQLAGLLEQINTRT